MAADGATSKLKKRGKYLTWIALAALLIYGGIMLGPYLRSTLVRDAAVTTWIHIATSPIYGEVARTLPKPGDRIDGKGQIAHVHNPRADRSDLDEALAEVARAEVVVAAAGRLLAELEASRARRLRVFEQYRSVYLGELKAELNGIAKRLDRARQERTFLQRLADRKERLSKSGTVALSDLDEAKSRLVALERRIADLEAQEQKLQTRHAAALEGTIVLDDGSDPDWGEHAMRELDAAIAEAKFLQTEAEASLSAAWETAAAEEETYQKRLRGHVLAPENAMLWSTIVGEGAAVDVGTPVAAWIDCSLLLVDVPVADAELALLEIGAPATVILEGDTRVRDAKIYLTRGSAATIKGDDLAALAKGRDYGVAQAILILDSSEEDHKRCPVGHAAYVDFPDIGMIDVLRARLRI